MYTGELRVGQNVKVKGTTLEGKVKQIGKRGLLMLSLTSEHSVFDRTIYHLNEVELID